MVSSTSLLIGLVSIFLYVTPCVSNTYCEQLFKTNIEKPFEVVLGVSKTHMVFCGGTLITNFYVLTAADCVFNRLPAEIAAFTAVKYLITRYDRFKLRSVVEVIVHALYNPMKPLNDNIALLRLGRNFLTYVCIFDPWVNKAILPQNVDVDNILRQELQVRLSGFGIISEYTQPQFDELMISYTTLVGPKQCRELYKIFFQYDISDKHICAYDPHISVYSTYTTRISDVGSSLIVNENVILGIAINMSSGFRSETYYPTLFTNVIYYRDWIEHIINAYDEDDLEMALKTTWNPEQVLPP